MKIAIATENKEISQHFGKCELFTIVEFDDLGCTIVQLNNESESKSTKIPEKLAEIGTDIVISGGIGSYAKRILKEHNIEVLTGIQGTVKEVIDNLRNGVIKSGKSLCSKELCEKYCTDK
ncbi:NifB/NifX family molybdenum-iron cluster-binding protein [bacterium]|nr:NifB/NifX family molybdenum-iron cluster-binding protein [bacterium]